MATLTKYRPNAGRGAGFSLHGLPPGRAQESSPDPMRAASAIAERNRLLERQNRALRFELLRSRRLVYVDGLTGLANRRCFESALASEIRRAARAAAPLCLLLCDLDFFQRCNDTFGHGGGDAVLSKLGEVLRAFCRRGGDVAARYGGEKFALLLPRVGTGDAIHIGETLRRKVANLSIGGADSCGAERITVSVGATVFHAVTPCRPCDVLRSADFALNRAKTSGRNRTVFQALARERCARR